MLQRKIENHIREYLTSNSERVLLIDGARQVGKSYIIRKVGQELFVNYIEVNMEEDKVSQRIFAEAKTVGDFYLALSAIAGDKLKDKASTLVFIDEIQAYDHLLTLLKFLKADDRFTYIASGSLLGVTLKNTSSIPLGSIEIKHMYPLDFEEFLIANGVGEIALEAMRTHFLEQKSLPDALHHRMMDLFRKYLLIGGMPAAVHSFVEKTNIVEVRVIQDNVHKLYGVDAARYEANHERLKIQRIYDMIPSNLENKKKRIVAKEIEGKKGRRMADYMEEFDYLISSGVALEVKAISNPSFPLIQNSGKNLLKLYLNDVGMLTGIYYRQNILPIMKDESSVNLGAVYETVVAQELRAHGFDLFYYDNKKNGEVDFLIDDVQNLTVMPLEVKSGKDYTVHSALSNIINKEEYHIHRAFVLSNEQKVFIKGGVTYIPVYYIMFFSPDISDMAFSENSEHV
jgi:predicted AAA+ superfamily ATPase